MHSSASSIFSLTNHEIYILTASDGGRENGQIATWILPATLAPGTPRIIAVLSPMNFTHELISASGRFVVQMLSAEQSGLVPLFGLESGRKIDKFSGMTLERTAGGLPLIPESCGWAECVIVDSMDSGDRIIYLADVVDQAFRVGKQPLRKSEAFLKQPEDIRRRLVAKGLRDGQRDRTLMKRFGNDT